MKKTCFVFLMLFAFIAYSRTPKEYSLERSSIEMVSEGIEFKPFNDMKAEQIKPLQSFRITPRGGSDAESIEVYKYDELWRRGQKIATYYNTLVKVEFYKLNYLPPQGIVFKYPGHVPESEFNEKIIVQQADSTFINSWFKAFTSKDIKLVDKYPKLTFAIKQKWVDLGQSENQFDFLIQSSDKRLFYMHAIFSDGEKDEAEKAIQYFLKSIKIDRPKEVKASNQSNKVKANGNSSEAFQMTVDKVKQEVANSEGWWFAQTPNYILKSNLTSKSKTFAKGVQERVEIMREVYERFIPPIDEIKDISVITVPNSRKEYVDYSGAPDWSAGVWSPGRRELIISQFDDRSKKDAEYVMMSTLNHEAFHQYIHYALNEVNTPTWFNEGHADLFASVKISGKKVRIIESDYSLRTLANYFKSGRVDLQKHIDLSQAEFYANKDLNYPLAWSLVYFLRKGSVLYKDEGYDKILDNLMTELIKSRSVEEANKKAFYGIDMAIFQKHFLEFWGDNRARSKALRNYIIPK